MLRKNLSSQLTKTPLRLTGALWILSLQVVFNLNGANDYHLFRRLMELTQEIPASRCHGHKLVVLSRLENPKFWRTTDRLNRIYYIWVNSFVSVISVVFGGLLFINRYEKVGIWYYLCIQTFHMVHTAYTFFLFFHSVFTTNFLQFITVMRIFIEKFSRIVSRTAELNALNTKRSKQFNRKLSRLLLEHNQVHLEMLEMNAFFSRLVCVNLTHFFL